MKRALLVCLLCGLALAASGGRKAAAQEMLGFKCGKEFVTFRGSYSPPDFQTISLRKKDIVSMDIDEARKFHPEVNVKPIGRRAYTVYLTDRAGWRWLIECLD